MGAGHIGRKVGYTALRLGVTSVRLAVGLGTVAVYTAGNILGNVCQAAVEEYKDKNRRRPKNGINKTGSSGQFQAGNVICSWRD